MHFNKAYNPEWVLYNELSQITPMPLAWDRTSLSQPAPTTDNGTCPTRRRRARRPSTSSSTAQCKDLARWATSPLWSVVDGPFKLQSFTSRRRGDDGARTRTTRARRSRRSRSWSSSRSPARPRSTTRMPRAGRARSRSATSRRSTRRTSTRSRPRATTYNKAASYSFNYFPLNFNSTPRPRRW